MSDAERLAGVATESVEQIKAWVEGTAGTFISEQAPLYVQEVIAWEIWSNAAMVMIGVLLAFASFVCMRLALGLTRRHKQSGDSCWDRDGSLEVASVFAWIFCGIMAMASPLILFTHAYFMLRPIVAPRVVILEHLRGLV